VAGPDPDPLAPGPTDRQGDLVEGVVPGDRLPRIGAARTDPPQRPLQPAWVVEDLVGRPRTQRKPRLSGLSRSPAMLTRPSSTVTIIPQWVGLQFIGHMS
jgi:hypothetical protein